VIGSRLGSRLRRLSIRWRLALTSAGLTFVILLLFAVVIGLFTADRLRTDFDNDLRLTAADLEQRIPVSQNVFGEPEFFPPDVLDAIVDVAATGDAAMRIVEPDGRVLAPPAPEVDLGPPRPDVVEVNGYRVVSEPLVAPGSTEPAAYILYGREEDSLESTIARMNLFLGAGVLGGTILALLAGLALARRAMRPIAGLTGAARDIARTRDPAARMPAPQGDDEVADLARTLEEMLRALDAARRETETTLAREREFVADASHELRTPLTSVLANLELLEAELEGESREIAGSALRSTQRMRRLVGDLLFLARADAGRPSPSTLVPTDLAAVVGDAVAETAPLAQSHEITIDAEKGTIVDGSPDDLHRLALNMVQNAVAHTPLGTHVLARVRREAGPAVDGARTPGQAVLEVVDDGPGIPADVRERVFDRFVRGPGGNAPGGGRGGGLGLAIVRSVALAHGGEVRVDDVPGGGARFVVRLPLSAAAGGPGEEARGGRGALLGHTSTTTGRTSGRRLSRS
jgi:signal transduction histidine kinase